MEISGSLQLSTMTFWLFLFNPVYPHSTPHLILPCNRRNRTLSDRLIVAPALEYVSIFDTDSSAHQLDNVNGHPSIQPNFGGPINRNPMLERDSPRGGMTGESQFYSNTSSKLSLVPLILATKNSTTAFQHSPWTLKPSVLNPTLNTKDLLETETLSPPDTSLQDSTRISNITISNALVCYETLLFPDKDNYLSNGSHYIVDF